jgi:probable rRNA maturation factor
VVRRAVRTVLRRERREADVSVTFLGPRVMRRLNLEFRGRDQPTDVLAFPLQAGRHLAGDIYICPAVARQQARQLSIHPRDELLRLVVHGTLHVLGYDHPEDAAREASPMWRRQERHLEALA